MTDQSKFPDKASLLQRIDQRWNQFDDFISQYSEDELTIPTDAAGWTAKDHIMHLAVWEDGINALLDGESRHERMGLNLEEWRSNNFEIMNAVIQQQHRKRSLDDVLTTFRSAHTQLMDKLHHLSDGDLLRPYRDYQPTSASEMPVIEAIIGDTYEHYETHAPWIAAIIEQD